MEVKERENMIGVLPKRKTMLYRQSQGNRDTTVYPTTPDHNIQSTTQGMTQALRVGKHLRRVMDNDGGSPDL
ncbi:Phosphoglycerate mutase-like protein AT74 [Glycine max]|nr:Phosphoglycerate mutase-like protein AT74 [Glycine max]